MLNMDNFRKAAMFSLTEEMKQKSSDRKVICITTCGYEARSIYWTDQFLKRIGNRRSDRFLVFGFHEYRDKLNRPNNNSFYSENGLQVIDVSSQNAETMLKEVMNVLAAEIKQSAKRSIEVHVDYSSMPRLWYCGLAQLLMSTLRSTDMCYFWYTKGEYSGIGISHVEYPSAGVNDFYVFSGSPSLNATYRTHLFGMGFDKIRTQAIWSVLDPQNLVCFYADPAVKPEYAEIVKQENPDVFRAARYFFPVPIADFVETFSRIRAAVMEFRQLGDVIIVPDGPKPLILASSLIPLSLSLNGIVCLHVTRRVSSTFEPIDVCGVGEPTGFIFQPEA